MAYPSKALNKFMNVYPEKTITQKFYCVEPFFYLEKDKTYHCKRGKTKYDLAKFLCIENGRDFSLKENDVCRLINIGHLAVLPH